MRSTTSLAGCCLIAGAVLFAAAPTPQLADAFEKKIVLVQKQSETPSRTPRSTTFTEAELNSYLRFKAGELLPTGLTEPAITLIGQGRITGNAVVDLDVVRQKQSRGSWFDPTSYLTGKLPVSATGTIVTSDGNARFEFERVDISGVSVPKSLLAQMVNYFTRTADTPQGASIDDTFEMGAKVRRVDVHSGHFIVIQ